MKTLALLISISLLFSALARADQYTGMQDDDPKQVPALQQVPGTDTMEFLPLPGWSHLAKMPPMPDVLSPNGKKVVVEVTPPTPSPRAPLAPPKETTQASNETATAKPTQPLVTVPGPVPPPSIGNDNSMVSVSPFLDWIKANPSVAAAQAREAANAYAAQAPAATPGVTSPTAPSAASAAPYWLPPLLDTAPVVVPMDNQTPGSSTATYSTPQR